MDVYPSYYLNEGQFSSVNGRIACWRWARVTAFGSTESRPTKDGPAERQLCAPDAASSSATLGGIPNKVQVGDMGF